MSDEQIISPASLIEGAPGAPVALKDRQFDKSFKRNIRIIGIAAVVCLGAIAFIVIGAQNKISAGESRVAKTSITTPAVSVNSKPSDMTPADEARLGRVQGLESDAAKADKNTYIPQELPLKPEAFKTPEAQTNGPGNGYKYGSGEQTTTPAGDPQREARIKQGLDLQLAAIIARAEAPPTQSAPPYPVVAAQAPVASASAGGASGGAVSAEMQGELVKALSIAGARLVSPLDTAKSDFTSAEITSGPLAGAYLIGKGRMVGEEGVQIIYTRMKFGDVSYPVNVTGLDNRTSSDAMAADVDRKLFSRYVMPVVFTTGQAYLAAVSRPAQTVVGSGFSTTVVTPGASAREAVAAGLSAGMGKAAEAVGQSKPSAFMPIDTSIALLFNDAVLKKAAK